MRQGGDDQGGDDVEVSAIIPWRNRVELLRCMLQSLARQDYRGKWEVVVADNRSTESAASAIVEVPQLRVRIVPAMDKTGVGYAANAGANAALGRKLLFVDADDEVSENYVRAMAESLDSFPFITSKVDSSTLNPAWTLAAYGEWQAHELDVWPGFLPYAGPNIGIRRSVFDAVGGWPEEYVAAAQDIAFSWRVQLAGVPLRFEPGAVYRYRHRRTLPEIYRQQRDWRVALPLLYREFRPSGMPGRSLRMAASDWIRGIGGLVRARNRADTAVALVTIAQSVGRLKGSIRCRTLYL